MSEFEKKMLSNNSIDGTQSWKEPDGGMQMAEVWDTRAQSP